MTRPFLILAFWAFTCGYLPFPMINDHRFPLVMLFACALATAATEWMIGRIRGSRAAAQSPIDVRKIDDMDMRELLSAKDVGKGRSVLKRILSMVPSTPSEPAQRPTESREKEITRLATIEECCRCLEALGAQYHSGRDLIAHLRACALPSTHQRETYCALCDREHQLHEDAQGFHHVIKGERVACPVTSTHREGG